MLYFDFETTNRSKGSALDLRNRILMVAWCEDDGPMYSYAGDIMKCPAFWSTLERSASACAHYAKFEMHWLKRLGFDIDSKKWHDTMLAEKILLGNIPKKVNLGDVADRYGYRTKDPLIDSLMKAGVCPSEMPQDLLMRRCKRDVSIMRHIMKQQRKLLIKQEQVHLYRNRCDFEVILTHIEAEGMLLDKDVVQKHYEAKVRELAVITKELDELTGGINMNSPDQKAHYLYGKLKFPEIRSATGKIRRNKPSKQFPKGRPKTDANTLTWLMTQAKTEKQKCFVELSKKYSK
ncbi:hypothetical protein LCGC14_1438270, partial [marine sediment metagenome]